MSRNNHGSVLRNISGCLFSTLLHDKASESAEIYILFLLQGTLHFGHETFDNSQNGLLVHTSLVGNFLNDLCFCHSLIFNSLATKVQKNLIQTTVASNFL